MGDCQDEDLRVRFDRQGSSTQHGNVPLIVTRRRAARGRGFLSGGRSLTAVSVNHCWIVVYAKMLGPKLSQPPEY